MAAIHAARVLEAAIFDMDGLLIDSEPTWRRIEVEVFGSVGLPLTESMCIATTGLRIDEVVAHWFSRSPWRGPSPHAVVERIVERMIEVIAAEGRALPGAEHAIEICAAHGLKLALASSSPERLIDATLARLGLSARFPIVVSAQHEKYGKPHPAVFLTTAERLGVMPTRCLVIEDSLNGVIAAKAARAVCVAVPAEDARRDPRFSIADRVLDSLEQLDGAWIEEVKAG